MKQFIENLASCLAHRECPVPLTAQRLLRSRVGLVCEPASIFAIDFFPVLFRRQFLEGIASREIHISSTFDDSSNLTVLNSTGAHSGAPP